MGTETKTATIHIGGMTCVNCQKRIQKAISREAGVVAVVVDYGKGIAVFRYIPSETSPKRIKTIIEKLGYTVETKQQQATERYKIIGILVIVIALYGILNVTGALQFLNLFPTAETEMGLGMLFIVGLLTSFHCIAMCGGINLSQCIPQGVTGTQSKKDTLLPSFLYNLGRVISYTLVGGIVGSIGAAISFSGAFRGVIQLIAGIFMIIMGINMLGIFPWLRKLTPRMPSLFAENIEKSKRNSKSPLVIGLLNGLMPCGPLQAMQIYALSTGGAIMGALSMLCFSLGTVPLMFGIGALSSILSKKFTSKVMAVGAALVVVFGVAMFTQGANLSNVKFPINDSSLTQNNVSPAQNNTGTGEQVQLITATYNGGGKYPTISVKEGIPVKLTLKVAKGAVRGCNKYIFIPEYNLQYKLADGDNIIEFTPKKAGNFEYGCSMWMYTGKINVG
ncbi:hypothetical protein FACS1894132_11610 [Clostridia bacterium]|nr:hypothetical protein FACS1894132_11610 [Clostridia bacterium]